MFEEKRDTSSLTERHVQLQEGSRTQSRTALRSMDYEQGQAHLAPDAVVQRSEDAAPETDKEKLLRLVGAFVDSKFGGDSQAAFGAYAKGGTVDKAGVTELLIDAGVKDEFGWKFSFVPGKVMAHFDSDGDGKISPEEFNAGMAG